MEAETVPTTEQEITRKSLETLEWLALSLHNGKMTDEQFVTGIDTLFMTVCGVASESVFDAITAARHMTASISPTAYRHFVNPESGEVITLQWEIGSSMVLVKKSLFGEVMGATTMNRDDAKTAKEAFDKTRDAFFSRGLIQL